MKQKSHHKEESLMKRKKFTTFSIIILKAKGTYRLKEERKEINRLITEAGRGTVYVILYTLVRTFNSLV